MFVDLGATRVVECWSDDVTAGKIADFRKAVQAEDDETVVFSFIEWPDKDTRDAAFAKTTDWTNDAEQVDTRIDRKKDPMPFDGTGSSSARTGRGGLTHAVMREGSIREADVTCSSA